MCSEKVKGRLVLRAQVQCGDCDNWMDLESRSLQNGAAEARKLGFRFTKAEGWLCPSCLHARDCEQCKSGDACLVGWDLLSRFCQT